MKTYTFKDMAGKQRTINIGDKVLYCDGSVGFITEICDCENCKKRGFCEPYVKFKSCSGEIITDYLSEWSYSHGFPGIYKIGNEIFNAKPTIDDIDNKISECMAEIKVIEDWIEHLNKFKNEISGAGEC